MLSLAFTSCETTKEIMIKEDGSGSLSSSMDLSSLIGIAKMSGGEGMEELEDKKIDTSLSLKSLTDSLEALTDAEKALAGKGTMNVNMDISNDVLKTKMSFPFANASELAQVDKISNKTSSNAIMEALSAGKEKAGGSLDEMGIPKASIDDYFDMTYTKNSISKKLNAEKHAKIGEDEGMEALREIAGQGMSPSNTIIIRLPRPAKKTEGKGISLSEDKKTVTIKESAEDFLDDAKSFEFTIEY